MKSVYTMKYFHRNALLWHFTALRPVYVKIRMTSRLLELTNDVGRGMTVVGLVILHMCTDDIRCTFSSVLLTNSFVNLDDNVLLWKLD